MKYKAVLFDFDYTLADATESILAGYRYAFEALGLPSPSEMAVRRTVGYLLKDGYTMLTGDRDPERTETFLRLFTERCRPLQLETVRLLPGARELLEALRANGVGLGIVSSKRSGALEPVLETLQIKGLMDFTIGGDLVKAPKPDPEGLNLGVAHFGVAKDEVLYCGDTVLDAETAQRAGTHFCAVLNGVTPAGDFMSWPHDLIAPGLMDLKFWLRI